MKRRVNVTIERSVVADAKRLPKVRGRSLSSLAESGVRRLIASSELAGAYPEGEHWLDRFHRKYLTEDSRAPTDEEEVERIRLIGMLK